MEFIMSILKFALWETIFILAFFAIIPHWDGTYNWYSALWKWKTGRVYTHWWISWLLMPRWYKEPRYKRPWWWPTLVTTWWICLWISSNKYMISMIYYIFLILMKTIVSLSISLVWYRLENVSHSMSPSKLEAIPVTRVWLSRMIIIIRCMSYLFKFKLQLLDTYYLWTNNVYLIEFYFGILLMHR